VNEMLATQTLGSGPTPVVLLHGFLGSGRNLYSLARKWSELAPDRTFLLMDLGGHGASPPLPPGSDLTTMAKDVIATARAQGHQGPLELVGHSLGGRVALAGALADPASIRSITILDITPSPIPDEEWGSGPVLDRLRELPEVAPDRATFRDRLIERGLSTWLADWALMNLIRTDNGYRWRIDREALAEVHERVNRADLWPAIENGAVPVRCVRGGKSRYVPDEDARRMEAAGCKVATLEDAGHYPHVDQPQKLLDLLAGDAPWQ